MDKAVLNGNHFSVMVDKRWIREKLKLDLLYNFELNGFAQDGK